MAKHELQIGKSELEILLNGTWEYAPPEKILDGLSGEDACRRLEGSPHTIAELVFHMNFWQADQQAIAKGADSKKPADFKLGESDFGQVTPNQWDSLRSEFLASYSDLLECADDPELMRREPNEKYNLGFMLANHTLHNAYHFGQIMLIKRMME